MKKLICLLLIMALSLGCFTGCGKKKQTEAAPEAESQNQSQETSLKDVVLEVEINMDNLLEYFQYKEYPSYYKEDDGTVTSVTIAYGLELKDIYTAATDAKYKHDMVVEFTGDVMVNKGDYQVDFDTLQVYGTTAESYVQTVSHQMEFWPKGDRTTVWSYGTYSSLFAIYLANFTITSAEGTVYLKYKYA